MIISFKDATELQQTKETPELVFVKNTYMYFEVQNLPGVKPKKLFITDVFWLIGCLT